MAKGSIVKEQTYRKILEMFPGSFMYNSDKELRINAVEDGQPVQLKLVLTAAKTPVECGADVAIPGAAAPVIEEPVQTEETSATPPLETSEEEKQNLKSLVNALGL